MCALLCCRLSQFPALELDKFLEDVRSVRHHSAAGKVEGVVGVVGLLE